MTKAKEAPEPETSETNGNGKIYGLLAAILAEVGSVGKGRKNDQQGYKFRGIDDVYEAVHPLFAKHGVFTLPRVLSEETSERTTQSGTILRFTKLMMAYDFFAADGSHVTAEVIGEAMDAGDKASNKAMSAAQKYALIQTLCIPTGETPDADSTTPDPIQPGSKTVSKSSTAPDVCPKCGSGMWNNSETKRNPKQPDYKCKNKDCDGAIWLDSKKVENKAEKPAIVEALSNVCRLLNEASDKTQWTGITLNEFADQNYGAKVKDLGLDSLQDLLKLLSLRLDQLKAAAASRPKEQTDEELEADIPF